MLRWLGHERRHDGTNRLALLAWDCHASAVGKMYLDTPHTRNLDRYEVEVAYPPSGRTTRSRSNPELSLCDFRKFQPLLPIIKRPDGYAESATEVNDALA